MAELPSDKLIKYSTKVNQFLQNKTCTLRELKSLLEQLQYATSVIPVGKCFLRRMYNQTIGVFNPSHLLKITPEIKEDLFMWKEFLDKYNSVTVIPTREYLTSNTSHMYTDSCKKGFAGTFDKFFVQGAFRLAWQDFSVEVLVLNPIFLLLNMFSAQLAGKKVLFHCDNYSIVHIINKQSSKSPLIMKLLRPMVLTMLLYNIQFSSVHIPGTKNFICDTLSRFQATD